MNLKSGDYTYWKIGAGLVSLGLLSLGLAWVSNSFHSLTGWASFTIMLCIAAGLLAGGWWLLGDHGNLTNKPLPRWLSALLIGAALLRLAAGVVWYVALPHWGHGTAAEKSGYIMADAAARDQAAWKLAKSDRPLWTAFSGNRKVDQYGGLLFSSAWIYRYLGGKTHQPLLMVVLSATFSALAVIFTWAFSKRLWGRTSTANLSAWIIALYPEAVLLGSSQLREAFTMTLTIIAFYGLIRYQQERTFKNLGWVILPLILCMPFSPPIAALVLGMLALPAIGALFSRSKQKFGERNFWIGMGLLGLFILIGLYFALRQFTPAGMSNPLEMLRWWLYKSAQMQAYFSQHASGWMQKIFRNSPEWLHLPLLLFYGILQPFLPAALVAGSQARLWPFISIARSTGWTLLLAFLLYAPLLAFRKSSDHHKNANLGFTRLLTIAIWIVILVASFRAGADMWDNPRYRATFAALQVALAAWAWIEHRQVRDPWLRRSLLTIGSILGWFIPWYLRRYTGLDWPVPEFFSTLGLGLASAFLLILWDWARTSSLFREQTSQPEGSS